MLVFALQQEKTKYRSVITQAPGYLKTLDPDYRAPKKVRKVQMILLVLVFVLNFVFTWVIPTACVYACVASETQALHARLRIPDHCKANLRLIQTNYEVLVSLIGVWSD